MFDFVIEINQSNNSQQIREYSVKKNGYFTELGVIQSEYNSNLFSCLGYSHDSSTTGIFENQSLVVVRVGKLSPSFKATEEKGMTKELTLEEIAAFYMTYEKNVGAYFKGNFVLVIWDKIQRKAFGLVGKSGLLKLYYMVTSQGLILATTLDSLNKHPLYDKKLNNVAIYETLLLGYPLGSETYCEGIKLLDNYSYLQYDLSVHKLIVTRYYDLSLLLKESPKYNWKETNELTPLLFNRAVDMLVEGNAKINAALTGGFDSRTLLSRLYGSKEKVQFYSWGATKQSCDVSIPLVISRKLGLNYKWIDFGESFLNDYDKYADMLLFFTDGLGNIKRCNQMYSHKLLSEYARINITGAIGSELLRPNNGLDTNIFPAMRDIVYQNKLSRDQVASVCSGRGSFFTKDFVKKNEADVVDHVYEEMSKFMVYDKAYLNLYNYTISQSLWKWFGQEFHASRIFNFTMTPYSDDDFIEFIVQTPVPSINQHAFERNPRDLRLGQLFYLPILESNMPKLMDIPTTRGYTPRQLRSKVYPLNILLPFALSKLNIKYLHKTASYNSKEWNQRVYSKEPGVLNYSDANYTKLNLGDVKDSEFSLKKTILSFMDEIT